MAGSLRHYRLEGRLSGSRRRTLCGRRWRPGESPRQLRREWTWLPAPAGGPDGVCPECLAEAAAAIRRGIEKAGAERRDPPWQRADRDGDLPVVDR